MNHEKAVVSLEPFTNYCYQR